MRVAGVRLPDGHVVWVDAGQEDVSVLQSATVLVGGGEQTGEIIVSPNQLVGDPPETEGTLLQAVGRVVDDEKEASVAAHLPPLGTPLSGGVVVKLDALKRQVTVRLPDGAETTVLHPGAD